MKSEDIHISDIHRILFGDVPGVFFIEVFVRTIIIYFVLMVSMRLMGKRMASQLGRNEMITMISLAAAIGVPIQSADRGILPVIIIAIIVVAIQQFIAKKASENEVFETITQDNISTLVEDCRLNFDVMKNTRITKELIFSQLRNQGIHQLGEVRRLYLEANGSFTVIENEEPVPGLSIIPDWDREFQDKICKKSNDIVCGHCGNKKNIAVNGETTNQCTNCDYDEWVGAVV